MGDLALIAAGDSQIERAPERTYFVNLAERLAEPAPETLRNRAEAFMPVRDQVLVRVCEKDSVTDEGFIIPDTAKEKQVEGTVLAVGPGRFDAVGIWVSTVVRPGDHVLFGRYSGMEMKMRGAELRLLREDEILGVIR